MIPGKRVVDDDSNQTGQMLAALADSPYAMLASKRVVADYGLVDDLFSVAPEFRQSDLNSRLELRSTSECR